MRRTLALGVGLTVLGLSAVLVAAGQDKDKVPEVGEIMDKAHTAKKGLKALIDAEVKKPKPNWETVQKQSKEYLTLAEALAKNDPPKGDKKSWVKLAKEFAEEVKSLDDAAKKKNAKGLLEASKKLGGKCDACHDAHQP